MPISTSQVGLFFLFVSQLPWHGHFQGRYGPPQSVICPYSSPAFSSSPRPWGHCHCANQSRLLCPWPSYAASTLFPWMLPNLDKKTELLQSHADHAETLHDPVCTGLERVKVAHLHSRQDLLFSALLCGQSTFHLEPAWTFFLPL